MPRIAVAGSLNMDLVALAPRIPGPGETLTGTGYLTTPGGKGANQAFAAAMLGGRVSMIGKVGADDFGAQLRANLQRAGCDTDGVTQASVQSGIALITVSDAGENCIVIVPGANSRFEAADVEAASAKLAAADFLLLQLESPLEAVIAAAAKAKAGNATVILDPAPAPGAPLPPELLAHVDILTPNEVEAAQLTGMRSGLQSPEDAATAARALLSMAPCVILKLGARGCLLARLEREIWIPAPSVAVVDTTAAGDCFNGALAVALAEGQALEAACRFAVNAAACSVTRLGAQVSMPTREQLTQFLGAGR